jgi:hypothetical protein
MPVLICETVAFYSPEDEHAFFSWLTRINCVRDVEGVGSELRVKICRRVILNSCLRELIALLLIWNRFVPIGTVRNFDQCQVVLR